MELSNLKRVYISGIGGIGVSALARFLVHSGIEVVGSDLAPSEITTTLVKQGIKVYSEQTASNVTFGFDLFVYSSAVPIDNPERVKAKELGITQKSYYEMLGEITKKYNLTSVAGTNGKSTTTAMIAGILLASGKDPSVIVGSQYEKLDVNFHYGKSDLFLLESCEYRAHMLLLDPHAIVLTNIEEDHLDFYRDLNHIIQTFQQFVNKLKQSSDLLILNNDDINTRALQLPNCRIVRYGLISGADVWATQVRKESGRQIFQVQYYGQNLGDFELSVPGDFNIYNALAAIAYCLNLDIPLGVIRETLGAYKGIWRRFQIVRNENITVVSDYAHHPTAVASSIRGAKEFFPGRRVVAVFQPHQHDRTKRLFDDFVKAFDLADVIVIPEIYSVSGREDNVSEVNAKDLALSIMEDDALKDALAPGGLEESLLKINQVIRDGDVVLVMGAGDIYKIAERIAVQPKQDFLEE